MKGIAIIPARGGSKRLPRKNILDFIGVPMINWTISATIKTGIFKKVIVSTEDEKIAEISKAAGAEVDRRSNLLATDDASVNMVCMDVLAKQKKEGNDYDFFCCLYATAPLRTDEDITNTVRLVTSGMCEQAMAVTNFNLPAFQAMYYLPDGRVTPLLPDLINKRSSELEEIVVDNGSTYVSTVQAFKKTKRLIVPNMRVYKMDNIRSIDIDEKSDYELALYYAGILGVIYKP